MKIHEPAHGSSRTGTVVGDTLVSQTAPIQSWSGLVSGANVQWTWQSPIYVMPRMKVMMKAVKGVMMMMMKAVTRVTMMKAVKRVETLAPVQTAKGKRMMKKKISPKLNSCRLRAAFQRQVPILGKDRGAGGVCTPASA